MANDLTSLNEVFSNLKVVYEAAVFSDMPLEDIRKMKLRLEEIQAKIAEETYKAFRGIEVASGRKVHP